MSSAVIKQINAFLMAGGFVSQDVHPQWFEILSDAETLESTNHIFSHFNRKVTRTSNGRTYYTVFVRMDEDARKEMAAVATRHKKEYRHVISFLRLTLNSISGGSVPCGGAKLRESTLVEVIANNTNLADSLKLLCAMVAPQSRSDQIPSMVKSVLRWAEKSGLIDNMNNAFGDWRFNGKVDWVNDMNAAFRDYIEIPTETDRSENLSLL